MPGPSRHTNTNAAASAAATRRPSRAMRVGASSISPPAFPRIKSFPTTTPMCRPGRRPRRKSAAVAGRWDLTRRRDNRGRRRWHMKEPPPGSSRRCRIRSWPTSEAGALRRPEHTRRRGRRLRAARSRRHRPAPPLTRPSASRWGRTAPLVEHSRCRESGVTLIGIGHARHDFQRRRCTGARIPNLTDELSAT
jgi:hypothetical protein